MRKPAGYWRGCPRRGTRVEVLKVHPDWKRLPQYAVVTGRDPKVGDVVIIQSGSTGTKFEIECSYLAPDNRRGRRR